MMATPILYMWSFVSTCGLRRKGGHALKLEKWGRAPTKSIEDAEWDLVCTVHSDRRHQDKADSCLWSVLDERHCGCVVSVLRPPPFPPADYPKISQPQTPISILQAVHPVLPTIIDFETTGNTEGRKLIQRPRRGPCRRSFLRRGKIELVPTMTSLLRVFCKLLAVSSLSKWSIAVYFPTKISSSSHFTFASIK